MNTLHKKSPEKSKTNPTSIADMGLHHSTENIVSQTLGLVENNISIGQNENSTRRKEGQSINVEFWKQVISDGILMKKYLNLKERFIGKDLILKSIFIKISILKNSGIEPKEKIINILFKILETQDLSLYRKYLFKIFSKDKKILERKGFNNDINDHMFELVKLFEQLFNNEV